MPFITIDNTTIEYAVKIDKRRKSVCFSMPTENCLCVALPFPLAKHRLEALIQGQHEWIKQRLSKLQDAPKIAHGAQISLLGIPRTLVLIPKQSEKIDIEVHANNIMIRHPHNLDTAYLISVLKDCIIKYAETYLAQRTAYYHKIIKVTPQRISLRDQKTRWGSCSSNGNISYNWRIIMAPEKIIDYLVVHELCHLLVPNHSKNFWEKVAEYCPEFTTSRAWLKQNGHLLTRIF